MTLDPQSINPVEVEREILRFVGLLETATTAVAKRGREAGTARATYKIEFAKARLRSEGKTVDERNDEATVQTGALLHEMEGTQAILDSAKEAARNMREQLGALRSLMANTRALLQHASGVGG